jgi:hypothetical protein
MQVYGEPRGVITQETESRVEYPEAPDWHVPDSKPNKIHNNRYSTTQILKYEMRLLQILSAPDS